MSILIKKETNEENETKRRINRKLVKTAYHFQLTWLCVSIPGTGTNLCKSYAQHEPLFKKGRGIAELLVMQSTSGKITSIPLQNPLPFLF